jgi:hypothetical protein
MMASETTNDSSAPDVVIRSVGNASPKTAAAAAVQAGGMSLKTVLGLVLAAAIVVGVIVGAVVGASDEQQNGQSTAQYSEQSEEQMLASASADTYIRGNHFKYKWGMVRHQYHWCRGVGRVAVSHDGAHVYHSMDCPRNGKVRTGYLQRSSDYGATFQTIRELWVDRVQYPRESSARSLDHLITDGTGRYVYYRHTNDPAYALYRSDDYGFNFTPLKKLHPNMTVYKVFSTSCDRNGKMVVVSVVGQFFKEEERRYILRSDDYGKEGSFTSIMRATKPANSFADNFYVHVHPDGKWVSYAHAFGEGVLRSPMMPNITLRSPMDPTMRLNPNWDSVMVDVMGDKAIQFDFKGIASGGTTWLAGGMLGTARVVVSTDDFQTWKILPDRGEWGFAACAYDGSLCVVVPEDQTNFPLITDGSAYDRPNQECVTAWTGVACSGGNACKYIYLTCYQSADIYGWNPSTGLYRLERLD